MFEKERIEPDLLKKMAGFIKKRFNAQKVILFGSYSYGIPGEKSDVDLFVIMDTNLKFYKQAALIRLMLDETFGVLFPLDIIVRTPKETEKRLNEGDFFIQKIIKEGIPL